MSRTTTALVATVKQFSRTPVLLALLVVLPAYLVGLIGIVLPAAPVTVVISGTPLQTTLADAILPMLATLAAVMVAGIAGLFLTADTLDADGWLALSGLPAHVLFSARATALVGASGIASLAATAVLFRYVSPTQPLVFLSATLVLSVTYGLLGALVGVITSKLAGVYVMLFGPAVDLFLVHSPLATNAPTWAAVLPGAYAGTAAMDAAFTLHPDWSALAAGVVYAALTAVVAVFAVARTINT